MSRIATLFATATAMAALAISLPAIASASGTSHAKLWGTKTLSVNCGWMIGPGGNVLCSASGIPRPKGKGKGKCIGDPGFVSLNATGKPQLLCLSQDSFVSNKLTKLATGSLWSGRGVTCHLSSATVLCYNGNNHGFVIGNGHYKSF